MSAPRGSRSNTLIAVPLALSFFAIGVALYGGNRGAQVQGPREIAAVSDDALWLVVDDEVLVLDAAGAVKSRFSTDSFGFANSFSTITRMPEGRVLLSVRGIADWPVVEAATGKVLKRIGPGSEEGKRAIDRTYHLAVAPNGDIAMATSGDHSVLLLDAEGRQKARSPDGLFRFANSVWHSDEGWWVADTNNHKLRLLDAATLAPKAEIALERGLDPAIWTGQARPHPAGSEERFATLARMQDGMIVGRVVDVDRSGKERVHYRLGDGAEPGALMWWRGHLLVVDSRRFSLDAYRPDGSAAGKFGDAEVQAALEDRLAQKGAWKFANQGGIGFALVALVVALWMYRRSRSAAAREAGTVRAEAIAGSPAGERFERLQFSGNAREYFRIWIVNLLFTLLTLGIYSAWAKVRKKRYFYGNTTLQGDSFDYFGSPRAILRGRILALAVFVIYAFTGQLWPASNFLFWALAALFLPWLVVRALRFNANNSAWRGLRFDFGATTKQAAWFYLRMLAGVVFSLGAALPWFMARQRAFVMSNHAFGTSRLECEIPARAYFGIYIRGGLLLFALSIPFGVMLGIMAGKAPALGKFAWIGIFLPLALLYAAYAIAYAYIQARTANLAWNGTHGPGLKFSCTLSADKLAKLYLGNLLAAACSAGLLIPWAVVRTLRYRCENLAVIFEGETAHRANPALGRVGATGEELGNLFNVDFGI